MSKLSIQTENDCHLLATWKNVVIESARGAATLASQRALADLLAQHVASHPKGVGHILLVPLRTQVPQAEVRDQMTANLRRYDADQVLGMALVLAGTGFWAGAARGAAAGIFLAARVRHPVKIFGELGPACQWLSGAAGGSPGLEWSDVELEEVLNPLQWQPADSP